MTLILVQQGKLSLDECVGRIDPRFVHLRDVTVFDVLSFRASLQTPQRIDATPDREEGLRRLFAVAVGPTPAIRLYSDINAMVIKYVVEARCGMAFADALKTFVFAPVGMTQTFCTVPTVHDSRLHVLQLRAPHCGRAVRAAHGHAAGYAA